MEDLQGYGSSTSSNGEEEAPLTDQIPSKRAKLTQLPPVEDFQQLVTLPPASALLGDDEHRLTDRVERHQGRIRSFPHVEGNFSTHVFIAVPVPHMCQSLLEDLLGAMRSRLPSLEAVLADTGATQCAGAYASGAESVQLGRSGRLGQPEYHLSVSRTAPVRLQQIESLVAALRQALRKLDTFCIHIGQPEVLVNDEHTRTFLALSARSSHGSRAHTSAATTASTAGAGGTPQALDPLLRAINAVSKAFHLHGLPRFYDVPRPHVSVAWLLGNQEAQVTAALAEPGVRVVAERLAVAQWQVPVARVLCRTGRRLHTVWETRAR